MADEKLVLEVTDRYGGNPPSWLRGCFSGCEAMGVVPVYHEKGDTKRDGPNRCVGPSETKPGLLKAWEAAHAKPHEEPCDGWHFVHCADCDGTGRVPWYVTVARIPRWIWRGLHFMATSPTMGPERTAKDVLLAFKCTFLADLGVWRP